MGAAWIAGGDHTSAQHEWLLRQQAPRRAVLGGHRRPARDGRLPGRPHEGRGHNERQEEERRVTHRELRRKDQARALPRPPGTNTALAVS